MDQSVSLNREIIIKESDANMLPFGGERNLEDTGMARDGQPIGKRRLWH